MSSLVQVLAGNFLHADLDCELHSLYPLKDSKDSLFTKGPTMSYRTLTIYLLPLFLSASNNSCMTYKAI